MKVTMHDGKLIITIGLIDPPKLSRRGRGLLVATSHGFRTTNVIIRNKLVAVSVNACIRVDEEPDADSEGAQPMPVNKSEDGPVAGIHREGRPINAKAFIDRPKKHL